MTKTTESSYKLLILLALAATAGLASSACTESSRSTDINSQADFLACQQSSDCAGLLCERSDGDTECLGAEGDDLSCAGLGSEVCLDDCTDAGTGFACETPGHVVDRDAIALCDGTEPNDPIDIMGARVDGDTLTLSVGYSGGCAEHGFSLCWDGSFAESYPVQAWATLHHDDGDDSCDGYLTEDITIDLRPLRDAYIEGYREESATVILHVGEHAVEYTFGDEPQTALPLCSDADPQDPISINAATISGDTLSLDVSYSGGCAEHELSLCWQDGTFLESNPVQARLRLNHEDNDDTCDGILNETITFDLTELRQAWEEAYRQSTGVIIVRVGDATVEYRFGDQPEPEGLPLCSDADPRDPVTISSATISGNTLALDVAHSGGCGEHDFSICWDGSFLESFPVQARLQLNHRDHDDPCDGIVNETLTFDLSGLRDSYVSGYQSETGTIIVGVGGQSATYEF